MAPAPEGENAMLRVIIADDEERICKLINILADWERLDMEVVGVACNGIDALSLVRRLQPDILITDIRMPGCDGLKVISQAKQAAPSLEVIIISGYAQFDYAQTAIQYGVGEYLLKPINKEALNSTLEKMGRRCRARKKTETDMKSLRLSREDDRERLRNNLIWDLLDGRFCALSAAQLEEAYHFAGRDDAYQVFLLKMDYDIEQYAEKSLEIVRNRATDIFCPALSEYCGDFLLGGRDAALYGVMNYPFGAQSAVRRCLRECLNQLVALSNLFGSVVFSMALGQAVQSPGEMARSFASARKIISERLTEGTGRLLEGDMPPSTMREMNLLARYALAAGHAIDVLSAEEADAAASALEQAACAVPNVRGWELLELVRGAGMAFVTRLNAENREGVLCDFDLRCAQCCQVPDLFRCLEKLQRDQLCLERQRSQDGRPVRLAKQYIQKHFSQPLTLEEVSAAAGFSVNYFSTLFKKETGEGFSKYLTRVRMEEAKELLRETGLSVQEILKRVGYGDIKHFTRVFRAETGLTPGEFRKLYG